MSSSSPSSGRASLSGTAPSYSLSTSGKRSGTNSSGVGNSTPEINSSDRTTSVSRRWPMSFGGGSNSGGNNSGSNGVGVVVVGSNSSNGEINTKSIVTSSKTAYINPRGLRDIGVRPGSASTVESYASAMPFSSDDSPPLQKKKSLSSPRSSSSSTNRTYTDSTSKGMKFEEMLASGETWVKSETVAVAKAESKPAHGTISRSEQKDVNVPLLTTRKASRKIERGREPLVHDLKEEVEEEDGEGEGRDIGDKSQQLTPRMASPQSSILANRSPLRPPKSVERSPSSSTQRSSHYATPPSGESSPEVSTANLPLAIPVHPHNRSDALDNDKLSASQHPNQSRGTNLLSKPMPVVPVRGSPSPIPPSVSPTLTTGSTRSRSRTSEAASPSSMSNSSQATFTVFPRQSNSLAQEMYSFEGEGDGSSSTERSGNALKERLKKTSGFLKRLGGGSTADKNRLNPPRMPKIVRKSSQSSFASEGGTSIANSTRSAPGDYQPRWGNETMPVPVPSIPSKYKGNFKSSKKDRQAKEDASSLLQETNTAISLQESGIDSSSAPGPKARHSRANSSSAGGSVGSASTDMRHALLAWEHEMDATLKQSGQDLESKTKIEPPKRHWTPSPQLPEYKLNRKSSFMDDEEETTEMLNDPVASLTSRDKDKANDKATMCYDSQYLSPKSPLQSQRSTSLGIGLPSGVVSPSSIVHSDPISSTVSFPSSSQHESSDDSFRYRRARDDNNASYASAMSYETAIDRPSFFIRHANRDDLSKDEEKPEAAVLNEDAPVVNDKASVFNGDYKNGEAGEEGEEEDGDHMDPEKSIRLITNVSSESEENVPKHFKEKTLMPGDVPSRSTSPAKDVNGALATDESISEDTDVKAKELALKCWMEDETFKKKERMAEWLGGIGLLNQMARKHYMDKFNFSGLRIDAAFRKLCDKLFLRAETQQVDRILSAFSQRFFTCNPQSKSILLSPDVVHALVFSILLLNTDLHVADIQDRMTRNQFTRNTLAAIQESNELFSSQTWTNNSSIRNEEVNDQSSLNVSVDAATSELPATGASTVSARLAPSSRRVSNDGTSTVGSDAANRGSVNKAWEVEMEGVLKDIYTAIKNDQIRLPITDSSSLVPLHQRKIQRAGSDRVSALKRGSIRGIQGLLGANSNNLRSDENLNMSRTSLNSTQKSFSDYHAHSTPSTSMASASSYGFQPSGLAPTLGFANTLSQSIIKEANDEDDNASIDSTNDDLTDDELALMGPPWAKEGMLTRKHYWDSPLKRAKDKNWTDCFVVVQKGMLSMFRFGDTGSGNAKSSSSGRGVGGGNWLSNATCIGEFSLAHTLANSLPPPGYNRSRPHVFALTLPSGSVYFFQTGHEELVQEWVSTCNYWAARQSREPLAGGVSNMEYGWNRVIPIEGHDDDDAASSHLDSASYNGHPSKSSLANVHNTSNITSSDSRSIRSGKSGKSLRMRATNNSLFQNWQDRSNGGLTSSPIPSSFRPSSSLANSERPMYINEWRAPAPPTVSSTLNEEDQLEACKRHKARVEAELTEHNALRQPMIEYFESMGGQSTSTFSKAISNFEKKASYLLSDLTKFTLYTATLTSANKLKLEKRDARQLNRMMLKADEELSRVKEEEEGPPVMS